MVVFLYTSIDNHEKNFTNGIVINDEIVAPKDNSTVIILFQNSIIKKFNTVFFIIYFPIKYFNKHSFKS